MSFITYSQRPHKAFSIPYSSDGSARCEAVTDFQIFRSNGTVPGELTEILAGYDNSWLYLDIVCHESAGIQADNHDGGAAVWLGGDMLEILLGGFSPYSWQQQYAVNAGGGYFSSRNTADLQISTTVQEDRWFAHLRFPLSQFPLQNLSIGFAVARYAKSRGEISIWGNMTKTFHDVEDYGEILFNDYNAAYLSKTGHMPVPALASRQDYEKRLTSEAVHAQHVIHGPWLSQPSMDCMTVSFGTAGHCGAFVEYRPAKTNQSWHRQTVKRFCSVLSTERDFHTLKLSKLKPGTEYEYRAVTVTPVTEELEFTPVHTFRTFGKDEQESFSFVFFSDIHSNFCNLKKILANEAVSTCDFLVSGGDCLSSANGADALYSGLIDPLAAIGKPVVFVRGNHEQRGPFTETGCRMMSMPGKSKSFFTFKRASTLFIVLDAGDDHPDDSIPTRTNATLLAAEKNWLKDLVNTEEFTSATHRIVLIHIPPNHLNDYAARMSAQLLNILESSKIDLVISGHIHQLAEMKANSGLCHYLLTGKDEPAAMLPFPVIMNSDVHALKITVTPDSCKYSVIYP